jgi:hypothetical protein
VACIVRDCGALKRTLRSLECMGSNRLRTLRLQIETGLPKLRKYDVALSFAGEDREVVERFATALKANGVRIFYDRFEQGSLWGKDLFQHLQSIYRDDAEFCIIFVSEHYLKKNWTKHEVHQAQSRSFTDESEYILPVRLDDSDVPGLNPTVGYVDLRQLQVEQLVDLTLEKLGKQNPPVARRSLPDGKEIELVEYNGHLVAKGWPRKIESAQYLTVSLVTVAIERIRATAMKVVSRTMRRGRLQPRQFATTAVY